MTSWQVGKYRLYMYASTENLGVIRVEEKNGPRKAHLYFREISQGNIISDDFYSLSYPYQTFQSVVDMLRNEKPIYVHMVNENNVYIGTHNEPIGEEES